MAFLPKGITSTEWKLARKTAIARSGGVCRICGKPLVPNARPRSAMSTEVDHITPMDYFRDADPATQRRYFLSQVNLQASHKRCNVLKAARQPLRASAGTNSLDWAAASLETS